MSSKANGNGAEMPAPAPVGDASENDAASAAHPSAMTLFAPDPNADPESVSVCLFLVHIR